MNKNLDRLQKDKDLFCVINSVFDKGKNIGDNYIFLHIKSFLKRSL